MLTLTSIAQRKNYGIDTAFHVPQGLKVGDLAPAILTSAITGEEINSSEILKKKKIVVLFYRGQWCPVCNKYLSRFEDSVSYIFEKDAIVLAIGPELPENASISARKHKANILVVADTTLQLLSAFDVLFHVTEEYQQKIHNFLFTNIDENNGQEEAQLPVPATYIIGNNGKIEYVHFDPNYKNRASVKDILDHL